MPNAGVRLCSNQFEKPTASLGFDALKKDDDGFVAAYLARHEGIDMEEAETLVKAFVDGIFEQLAHGETVAIPEVGMLRFDEQREIVFEPCESCDFNGDAFGLSDLNPRPVYDAETAGTQNGGTVAPPKTETKTDEQEDDKPKKRRGWLWLLPLLLLGGAALWYFKFYTPEIAGVPKDLPVEDPMEKPIDDPIKISVDTLEIPNDSIDLRTDTVKETPVDTIVEPVVPVEIVMPPAEAKAFIVGGCFAVEQNALNMTRTAWEQGFANAFVMRWGSMYYVCYDSYTTVEGAKADLPKILTNYNDGAWILTK